MTDAAGNPLNGGTDEVISFYFLRGDANHDATVNLADFNILASNFGQSGKLWSDADFNYDGSVNLVDLNLLAGNFGLSAGADGVVDAHDWAALASVVPEPAFLVPAFVVLAMLRMNRHRRG